MRGGDLPGHPQMRLHACFELSERKGFHQVIDRTGPQPHDPVIHFSQGSQNDHRQPRAMLGKFGQDLTTVTPREHQVEHDQVDLIVQRQRQSGVAIQRRADREPGRGKTTADESRQCRAHPRSAQWWPHTDHTGERTPWKPAQMRFLIVLSLMI